MQLPFGRLFKAVRSASEKLPWSEAIKLQRSGAVLSTSYRQENELEALVEKNAGGLVARVELFLPEPGDDDAEVGDWICDCNSELDPCLHVIATVIALRQNDTTADSVRPTAIASPAKSPPKTIAYRLKAIDNSLYLERFIGDPTREGKRLTVALASLAPHANHRLSKSTDHVAITKEDFAIDQVLEGRDGLIAANRWPKLLETLQCLQSIIGPRNQTYGIKTDFLGLELSVTRRGTKFQLKLQADRAIETTFKNGVVLTTTDIHPLRRYARLELQGFKDSVRTLTSRDLDRFCSEELPELSKIVAIHDPHGNLPTVVEEPPNLEIIAETDGDLLSLTSRMVYGQPPMAYIEHGRLIATSQSTGADGNHLQNQQMPRRLPEQERVLAHELSSFGVVAPGQTVHYQGCSALHQLKDLTSKIAQLPHRLKKTVQCHGAGWQSFASIGALTPELSGLNDEAALQFQLSPSTSTSQGASGAPSRNRSLESYTLDPETVYQAFIAGEHHVAIYEERGSKNLVGFAELPEDWLRRYGDILGDYLAAKRAGSKLGSAANLVGYEELFDGLGAEVPNLTTKLATIGEDFSGIPQTPTPAGLNAILRPYQSQGYQWLCFLRDHELGGILADDMGLGKTLQTIAVLKGHCLVIVPKSLLGNWQSECQRFDLVSKCQFTTVISEL